MLEQDTIWPTPLALVRHFLPLLPTADGSLVGHWAMARALCSVAEDVMLLARPQAQLLPALELAEVTATTDELGRLLLYHLPFRNAAARQAWPQVQAYLLQVLPAIERLLVAGTPFPGMA
ncbi:MAG: hypothetical protein ACRYG7_45295 [Janthinobacterium lividum]